MTSSLTRTSKILKIVLDTNLYVSALLYGGMTEVILDLIATNKLQLLVSPELITEVLRKFHELEADEVTLQKVHILLDHKGAMVIPSVRLSISRDLTDNFLLELAETAQADFLITRDKDVLALPNQTWKETKIVRPEEFLPFLRSIKLLL